MAGQEQRADFGENVNPTEQGAGQLRDTLGNVVGEPTVHRVQQVYEEGKDRIRGALGQVKEFSRNLSVPSVQDMTGYVRRNPMAAIAIGFGLGIVFGMFFPRRSSSYT